MRVCVCVCVCVYAHRHKKTMGLQGQCPQAPLWNKVMLYLYTLPIELDPPPLYHTISYTCICVCVILMVWRHTFENLVKHTVVWLLSWENIIYFCKTTVLNRNATCVRDHLYRSLILPSDVAKPMNIKVFQIEVKFRNDAMANGTRRLQGHFL